MTNATNAGQGRSPDESNMASRGPHNKTGADSAPNHLTVAGWNVQHKTAFYPQQLFLHLFTLGWWWRHLLLPKGGLNATYQKAQLLRQFAAASHPPAMRSSHGARQYMSKWPSPPICLLPGYTNTWCFLMMLLLFTVVLTIQVFLVTRQKQECTTKRNTMTQLRLYNQHRRHYIVKQPNKEALPLVGVCSYFQILHNNFLRTLSRPFRPSPELEEKRSNKVNRLLPQKKRSAPLWPHPFPTSPGRVSPQVRPHLQRRGSCPRGPALQGWTSTSCPAVAVHSVEKNNHLKKRWCVLEFSKIRTNK